MRCLDTGAKLKLTKTIRSQKTGMFLPKEGKLVYATENLGRMLLLVEFEDGHREYLFDNEVECASFDLETEEKTATFRGHH